MKVEQALQIIIISFIIIVTWYAKILFYCVKSESYISVTRDYTQMSNKIFFGLYLPVQSEQLSVHIEQLSYCLACPWHS